MRANTAAVLLLAWGLPRAPAAQVAPRNAPTRAEVIAAAKDVMQTARYATLITIGDNGQPQARIVDPLLPEGDFTVWIGTNPLTRKVAEIRRDPRVTLLYFNAAAGEYVTVLGTATLVTDSAEKARHWKGDWAAYYKDGPRGEGYLLLRVRPNRLEVVSPRHGMVNDPKTWRPITVEMPGAASDASAARRPIIDMHLHALTVEAWTKMTGVRDLPPNPTTGKPAAAKTSDDILRLTLEAMDRYNITIGVLSGPLETVYAWKAKAPDRFLASAKFGGRPASDRTAVDPSPSLDSLRREHAAGRLQALGEITSAYEGVDFDGPELAPYFALAAELKMPVGVHTGLTFPGAVYTCCPRYRIERGNPVHLDQVLARNRDLRLYIMHMGEMFQESTLAILHMYPQVYVDVATMDWGMPREQFYANLQALMQAGLGKRIMFGSDQMVWPELIGQAIETIESAPFLSDEQKHDIFYNNAARFLGLPELPVPMSRKVSQQRDSVPP